MKLINIIFAAALVASVACTKDQGIPETVGDAAGQMTITAINPQIKTTTTDGVNVKWEKGDEIALFVSGGGSIELSQSALYKTYANTPSPKTTFVLENDKQPVLKDGKYLAIYPASQLYLWSENYVRCSADIPFEQKVSSPGWDKRASLMAASSTTNEFTFRHCVAYVKFTVTENSPLIKSFKVASENGEEILASRVLVTYETDNKISVQSTTPTGLQNTEVTLSMENGEVFPVGTYYVAILPKTYASGLEFTCLGPDGNTFGHKVTQTNLPMTAGTIGIYGDIQSTVSGSGIDALKPFDIFNMPKRVSIIGDSISTFEGTLVTNFDAENGGAYYPIYENGVPVKVTSVTEQYWYKIINNKMSNAVFDVNNSLRGSMVVRRTQENYLNVDFGARTALYGIGSPDVVFINGGTNDCTTHNAAYEFRPGLYRADMYLTEDFLNNYFDAGFVNNPAYNEQPYKGMVPTNLPTDDEFSAVYQAAEEADTWDEVLALEDRSFIHAYVKLLNMIHFKHPNAKVVMIIPDQVTKRCSEAIVKIAEHYEQIYGYKCVNFFGLAGNISKASGAHPDGDGFTYMANTIYDQVGEYIDPKK